MDLVRHGCMLGSGRLGLVCGASGSDVHVFINKGYQFTIGGYLFVCMVSYPRGRNWGRSGAPLPVVLVAHQIHLHRHLGILCLRFSRFCLRSVFPSTRPGNAG